MWCTACKLTHVDTVTNEAAVEWVVADMGLYRAMFMQLEPCHLRTTIKFIMGHTAKRQTRVGGDIFILGIDADDDHHTPRTHIVRFDSVRETSNTVCLMLGGSTVFVFMEIREDCLDGIEQRMMGTATTVLTNLVKLRYVTRSALRSRSPRRIIIV